MMRLSCILPTSYLNLVTASQYAVKRRVTQQRDSYDFIIAGGGTTGLTVADRLSESLPNKTDLVIGYGDIEYAAESSTRRQRHETPRAD